KQLQLHLQKFIKGSCPNVVTALFDLIDGVVIGQVERGNLMIDLLLEYVEITGNGRRGYLLEFLDEFALRLLVNQWFDAAIPSMLIERKQRLIQLDIKNASRPLFSLGGGIVVVPEEAQP